MHAEQLKLLAPELRAFLSVWGIQASHGQVLDLLAAVPGLRNWSEVRAFRTQGSRDFDVEAAGRMMRRITTAFPEMLRSPIGQPVPEDLIDVLAPWKLEAPQDPSRRQRLVVVSEHAAAGCMKQARLADRVEGSFQSLVWGPVPAGADDPASFFDARLAAWDADPQTTDQPDRWLRERPGHGAGLPSPWWYDNLSVLPEYERIELWVDPDPNAQLQLLQMLSWFGGNPALVERLFIVHLEKPLAEFRASQVRRMDPSFQNVGETELELATRAWHAFRQPTPQAWAALLTKDLTALPGLRRTALALLNELPATGCGLRATEWRMLNLIAAGEVTAGDMLQQLLEQDPLCVFRSHLLRLLQGLARGPLPAILGIEAEAFDLSRQEDQKRLESLLASTLELSDFGQALLDGRADVAQHARINHWWGGTQLTNHHLWRWDASAQALRDR